MSDDNNYLGTQHDPQLRLKADVLMLQLKGAGYAAVFCIVAALSIWALYGLGLLLPEESKNQPDPTPFSYNLTVPVTVDQA
ncbi:RC-LH1 core complex protein PufX [Yoonia sp. 208BN28-4]|uniref:RC-LH1 core complex protein PufX n=1 Tax=Yoonia sp. 208BN28-4 TaxID=3126505 RepID=UPI0030B7304F